MGALSAIDAIIEKKLMDLHCAYIGKVVSTDGTTATVQPLGQIKEYGSDTAKTQAVVSNVPIACQKMATETMEYADADGNILIKEVLVPATIARGDIVVCVCADRDISAARRGNNEVPPAGRHSISDSIIIGIL